MSTTVSSDDKINLIKPHHTNNLSGFEQIAESNKAVVVATTEGRQVSSIDVMEADAFLSSTVSSPDGKPNIGCPTSSFSGLSEGDNVSDRNLAAIIGQAMILQAKANSNFWSTMWEQASDCMNKEFELAPVIKSSIEVAYKNQADATRQDAIKSQKDGWANILSFAGSMGMGAFMEVKEAAKAAQPEVAFARQGLREGLEGALNEANQAEAGFTRRVEDLIGGAGGLDRGAAILQAEGEDVGTTRAAAQRRLGDALVRAGERAVPVEEGAARLARARGVVDRMEEERVAAEGVAGEAGIWSKIKRGFGGIGKFIHWKELPERLTGAFSKGINSAQAARLLSEGVTGVTVNAPCDRAKANFQEQEGIQQAQSEMSKQMEQIYGQGFGRADNMRESSQQSIDYAMNILKSAIESLTSASSALFRA